MIKTGKNTMLKTLTTQILAMEDLVSCNPTNRGISTLPELTQYGMRLPFRVAVVGQTDSDKTHSIMHRWLGGKILC